MFFAVGTFITRIGCRYIQHSYYVKSLPTKYIKDEHNLRCFTSNKTINAIQIILFVVLLNFALVLLPHCKVRIDCFVVYFRTSQLCGIVKQYKISV